MILHHLQATYNHSNKELLCLFNYRPDQKVRRGFNPFVHQWPNLSTDAVDTKVWSFLIMKLGVKLNGLEE
jgi:hypothetical protein